jgi:hypothetical protein
LTVQNINNRQLAVVPAARPNSAGTKSISAFSLEESLGAGASTPPSTLAAAPSSRPLIGVSRLARQLADTLHRAATGQETLPADVPASTDPPASEPAIPQPAASNPAPAQIVQAQAFYITNPSYDPANPNTPEVIQHPAATAAPQAIQWTSPNGLTTTGVLNPFGLTKNDPSIGFYGGV